MGFGDGDLARWNMLAGLDVLQAQVGAGVGGPGYSTLTSWLGVPYLWGGGHNVSEAVARATGVDCSGLVDQVFGQTGNTGTQVNIGVPVSRVDSLPGDLAFFSSRAANEPHHVGIIVTPGGTRMINAPHTGTVVRYDDLFSDLSVIKRWPNSPGAIGTFEGDPSGVAVDLGGKTINTPVDFAVALEQAMGDPVTNPTNAAIMKWANAEGGNWHNAARFNPLNTTQRMPGSQSMNSVGVQSYLTWAAGIAATARTINNGNYPNVQTDMQMGTGFGKEVNPDLVRWGTGAIFDKGGWLPPKSKTYAINNTSHWEPVGNPKATGEQFFHVPVNVDARVAANIDLDHATKIITQEVSRGVEIALTRVQAKVLSRNLG